MDFIADENVPSAVIERLRSEGHSVIAVSETAKGIPDVAVMAAANSKATLLITHDRDFGELAVAQGLAIVGVLLLETERLSVPAQADRLSACLADGNRSWAGFFSVIEPSRIRQRAL